MADLPKGKFPNGNQHSQEQVRNQHLTKPDLQKLAHSIKPQLSLPLSFNTIFFLISNVFFLFIISKREIHFYILLGNDLSGNEALVG